MKFEYVLEGNNIKKKFRGFTLDVPQFHIPKGFATALIGENGAGKTTLMNILAGIRLDYKGELIYFGQYHDKDREENPIVKEQYAYTGPGTYYLPQWTVGQIRNLNQLLFENFHEDRFEKLCERLAVGGEGNVSGKKVRSLSDGNKMKLMIASALARDTKLLMMDEPASPLVSSTPTISSIIHSITAGYTTALRILWEMAASRSKYSVRAVITSSSLPVCSPMRTICSF